MNSVPSADILGATTFDYLIALHNEWTIIEPFFFYILLKINIRKKKSKLKSNSECESHTPSIYLRK